MVVERKMNRVQNRQIRKNEERNERTGGHWRNGIVFQLLVDFHVANWWPHFPTKNCQIFNYSFQFHNNTTTTTTSNNNNDDDDNTNIPIIIIARLRFNAWLNFQSYIVYQRLMNLCKKIRHRTMSVVNSSINDNIF